MSNFPYCSKDKDIHFGKYFPEGKQLLCIRYLDLLYPDPILIQAKAACYAFVIYWVGFYLFFLLVRIKFILKYSRIIYCISKMILESKKLS